MLDFERKFIETIELSDYEVETEKGWVDIEKIGKTVEYEEWTFRTKSCYLKCADTHIVFCKKYLLDETEEIFVKDLKKGYYVDTKYGFEEILYISKTDVITNMFDLQLPEASNHTFYTNGILSHNSMWLHNIGINAVNQGKNVLIVTLEMSTRKVMKRLGSMRLKIPVNDYDTVSKDAVYMKNRINAIKTSTVNGLFGGENPGKIIVKKFNTGDCTITDLDLYLKKLIEVRKWKPDMVIIDYLTLMSTEKHFKDIKHNLYLKGKHISEGLRFLAGKYDICVITAVQTDKTIWGAADVKIQDISESKSIAETSDMIFSIIRNSQMKKENKYKLKTLKLRDGDNREDIIDFNFNTTYLLIENDHLAGSVDSPGR